MRVVVLGGGVFGLAGALELALRGHAVTVREAGRVPRPEAASTDLNKLVRMDYGADLFYLRLMRRALEGWRRWNAAWERPLYHEDGLLVLASSWDRGGFERDSADALAEEGVLVAAFAPGAVPVEAWRWDGPGYVNPTAGWAESGEVVAAFARRAREAGVVVREDDAVTSPRDALADADVVVVAAGTWTHHLLPELADRVVTVGQPVFHLLPDDPGRWSAPRFLPFASDIRRTGWYGFPANRGGVVKIANHGPGLPLHPDAPRIVPAEWDERLRAFLGAHLPGLADAPIVLRRLCLYSDTFDGDFLIDRHPEVEGLVVAAGGSGHAFKFAPVLGEAIADRVEGKEAARWSRWAWRARGERRSEAARNAGPGEDQATT